MTQNPLKCPFRQTLITRDFACELAKEVTHRDGPGIVCEQADAQRRCTAVLDAIKAAALPALEVVDDLTQMPASIMSKIQYGSLVALSEILNQSDQPVENINVLVQSAMEKYQTVENFDFDKIVPVIKDYRLRKRRNR